MTVDWKKVGVVAVLIAVVAGVTLVLMGCNKDGGSPPPIVAKPGQIVVMPPDSQPQHGAAPANDQRAIQRDMERLGRIEANQSR